MSEEITELLDALDKDTNSSVIDLTTSKIKKIKNDILQQLQLKGPELKKLHKKLKNYRYCTDLRDLQYGFYIRWIPLKNPDKIYLTNGGLVCDVKLVKGELHVLCKNVINRFFQFKFDEVIIFQKISEQEQIILGILDYLDN
tara:strand:+ start:3398 stop:3823 length:426 start_codon:yes stop_codon:yes gene_type:complete